MKKTVTNKSGIQPIPVDYYTITGADVIKYLQEDILGFPIRCELKRWVGCVNNVGYVRLRLAISKKDLASAVETEKSPINQILAPGKDIKMKKEVVDSLKPFMYPKRQILAGISPSNVNDLINKGLSQSRLAEIIKYSEFVYNDELQIYMIYLKAEAIIKDMLSIPADGTPDGNKIDGNFGIVGTKGDTEKDLNWFVQIRTDNSSGISNVSLDNVFGDSKK